MAVNKRLSPYTKYIMQYHPELYTTYINAYCHDAEGNAYNRDLMMVVDLNKVMTWHKGDKFDLNEYINSLS